MDTANFVFEHPNGPIYADINENGVAALRLPTKRDPAISLASTKNSDTAARLLNALQQYFAGIPEPFHDVPLDLSTATKFRREVWETARMLTWGETCSYGQLAEKMGRSPRIARAVGQALKANPVPILIPCHRIVSDGGGLGGFSAGLDWKRELLRIEGNAFGRQGMNKTPQNREDGNQ